MKFWGTETVASAPPQKREAILTDLGKNNVRLYLSDCNHIIISALNCTVKPPNLRGNGRLREPSVAAIFEVRRYPPPTARALFLKRASHLFQTAYQQLPLRPEKVEREPLLLIPVLKIVVWSI
jgi:hypothetical protein